MGRVPLEKLNNEIVAKIYKSAAEIFKKQLSERFYEQLQENGMDLLEQGIEHKMDPMMFNACISQEGGDFWVEIRKHRENYGGKLSEFEKMLEKYR